MYIAVNLLYTQLLLHRRPKADDRVHFQSPDDAVTFDGFENPMSKDPSSKHIIARKIFMKYVLHLTAFANPLYLNPDEMETFEESAVEPPPDDGTF